jgi:glycopeptide antibiotics resistance protein
VSFTICWSQEAERTMGSMTSHMGKIERALLPLWALFIALVGTFPFTNFVGHSHWEYIHWFPTVDNFRSPRFLFDIVANMALFLPLGYLLDRSHSTTTARRSLLLAAGAAGLLSLSIEWFQVYCHNRYPSTTDVVSNVTGSLIGAFLSIYRQKMAASPPHHTITPSPPDHSHAP